MNDTTLRPAQTIGSAFVAKVEKVSNQKLLACYQCGKCSAGCPMAAHMDILPNMVVRMAQLGMQKQLLASRTIWMCVSCMTCNTRCPKDIHIAEVMESLRQTALQTVDRCDHLKIQALPASLRADLPPIATISAMRKLSS